MSAGVNAVVMKRYIEIDIISDIMRAYLIRFCFRRDILQFF
jgi:hypothetical protein